MAVCKATPKRPPLLAVPRPRLLDGRLGGAASAAFSAYTSYKAQKLCVLRFRAEYRVSKENRPRKGRKLRKGGCAKTTDATRRCPDRFRAQNARFRPHGAGKRGSGAAHGRLSARGAAGVCGERGSGARRGGRRQGIAKLQGHAGGASCAMSAEGRVFVSVNGEKVAESNYSSTLCVHR